MKKLLSVALAVIIAFATFSICAFADKPAAATENAGILANALKGNYAALATQSTAETGTDAPEEPEETQTRYEVWRANVKNLEEFKYSGTSNLNFDFTICVKGDAASYELNYSGTRMKLVLKDNSTYLYFVNFPFFYLSSEDMSIENAIESGIPTALGTFVSAKEENGYYVEEYDEGTGFIAHCYFDGDKLVKIEEYNEDTGVKNDVSISYEVKDKEVRLPLLAVDLTPFISYLWFFMLFL